MTTKILKKVYQSLLCLISYIAQHLISIEIYYQLSLYGETTAHINVFHK